MQQRAPRVLTQVEDMLEPGLSAVVGIGDLAPFRARKVVEERWILP